MEVRIAMLCDAANESKEGKLNVLGEFDSLFALKMPVQWPRCTVVLRLEAHATEGASHSLQVRFTDADHKDIQPPSPVLPIKFGQRGPGIPLRAHVFLNLDNLKFQRFGDYAIHILVNGRHETSIPFYVRPHPKSGEGPSPT